MSDFCDYDELTWVATIVGAHGIKGAVKVKYWLSKGAQPTDRVSKLMKQAKIKA